MTGVRNDDHSQTSQPHGSCKYKYQQNTKVQFESTPNLKWSVWGNVGHSLGFMDEM